MMSAVGRKGSNLFGQWQPSLFCKDGNSRQWCDAEDGLAD
jgi:hypothetical protein